MSDTEQNEELVYGGICPVCGDEFTDGFERLSELEGESIEGVRICIIDPPEENLFHLPEDQSGPVMPASRLAAELGHYTSVKRAKVQFPYRIHLRVTDDGLSRTSLNTIREYGWKVSGFTMDRNGVSVVRDDRRGDRDV